MFSTTRMLLTRCESSRTASLGKGHKVMGRRRATCMPSSAATCMTFLDIREEHPKAIMATSGFSLPKSSYLTSFSSIVRYFFWSIMLRSSIFSGCNSSEVITLTSRPFGFPRLAHGHSLAISSFVRRGCCGCSTTFSIICPITPSASMITGMRYLKARSNPNPTKSAISCTLLGASTIRL